jgi:hypothetical protein
VMLGENGVRPSARLDEIAGAPSTRVITYHAAAPFGALTGSGSASE